jgi:hypothetical protein
MQKDCFVSEKLTMQKPLLTDSTCVGQAFEQRGSIQKLPALKSSWAIKESRLCSLFRAKKNTALPSAARDR